MSKGQKAMKILREEGVASLLTSASKYLNGKMDVNYNSKEYHDQRIDNQKRWSFIKPHISNHDTCLDVGCASGYFTAKCANEGLLTIGLDDLSQSSERLQNAWKRGDIPNVAFGNWRIKPDNVQNIPRFDVILLMSIYHHFVKAYGIADANYMVKELGKKSDILIFEMPAYRWTARPLTIKADSIDGKNTNYSLSNHQDLNSKGVSVRIKLGKHLPPGKYKISANSNHKQESDTLFRHISYKEDDRVRIRFEEEKIQLIPSELDNDEDIDDLVKWHKQVIEDIFHTDANVVDFVTTDYVGDWRKSVVYIIKV